jgi:hypothetical protein
MITITVTGKRNEGKTTTALRIVGFLRLLGMDVEYEGFDQRDAREMEREFLRSGRPIVGQRTISMRVIDKCTDE